MNNSSLGRFAWYCLPLGLYAVAALWYLSDSPYSRSDFPLDDAWIHQVYARSFAHGEGFAYNTGQQEAGSTSPLWAITTAPAHWLKAAVGGSIVWYVKLIGFILGVVCIYFVFDIVHFLTDSAPAAALASTLLALEPRFLFCTLSGMEVILVVMLWVAGVAALTRRRYLVSSMLFGLLPTARPEAIIVLVLYLALVSFDAESDFSERRLLHIILLGIPSFLWVVFCYTVNGTPLPNTYYLKSQGLILTPYRLKYLWEAFAAQATASTVLRICGLISVIGFLLRRKTLMTKCIVLLIIAPCVFALGVVATREMWTMVPFFYWTRWIDPAFIILAFAAFFGFAISLRNLAQLSKSIAIASRVVFVFLLLWYVAALPASLQRSKSNLSSDSRTVHFTFVSAGEAISRLVPLNDSVSVWDAGASRYFGGRFTVDLIGLNNADICMKKVSRLDMLLGTKWILIAPRYFEESSTFPEVRELYDPIVSFADRIPGEGDGGLLSETHRLTLYKRRVGD